LWPTLSALWIAADGFPGWHLAVVFVAGTVIMRSAGCCVNDVADRDFDRHVKRTAQRPVTSGRVSVREAMTLGAALGLVAFATYDLTNLATLRNWPIGMSLLDMAWGSALSAIAAATARLALARCAGRKGAPA